MNVSMKPHRIEYHSSGLSYFKSLYRALSSVGGRSLRGCVLGGFGSHGSGKPLIVQGLEQ